MGGSPPARLEISCTASKPVPGVLTVVAAVAPSAEDRWVLVTHFSPLAVRWTLKMQQNRAKTLSELEKHLQRSRAVPAGTMFQQQQQQQPAVASSVPEDAELPIDVELAGGSGRRSGVDYKHEYIRLKEVLIPKYRTVIQKAREQAHAFEKKLLEYESKVKELSTENNRLKLVIEDQRRDLEDAVELLGARERENELQFEIANIDRDIDSLAQRLDGSLRQM